MGWRGIPILAALGVIGTVRVLYDPMPSSAPAAVVSNTDGPIDLSQVDFSPWLSPTAAPTTAPTTRPFADDSDSRPAALGDLAAGASTSDLVTYTRNFIVGKLEWNGVASQPNSGNLYTANSFGPPAIDIGGSSSFGGPADYATEFSGASLYVPRSKSPDNTPAAPLSAAITSANEPAYSIVGFDIPENSPLPRPTTSLPPASVPEPSMMLIPIFGLGMSGLRRRR
jgi:hypothetical protein